MPDANRVLVARVERWIEVPHHAGRIARHDTICRHVFRDDGTRSDDCIVPDRHAG
jgi:hypothetical protein